MTVVEFFDNCSVENIASALLCAPGKVILFGDNENKLVKSEQLYSSIVASKGLDVVFDHRKANRNDLINIVEVLSDIVEKEGECVFDLEGGEDLFLVAVGIVYEKYRDRIQLHRFNIHTGTLYDCDADGKVCNKLPVKLSVEENVLAYGGRIITTADSSCGTNNVEFTDDFINDIEQMWKLCSDNTGRWNSQTACISKLCSESKCSDGLSFKASMEIVATLMKKNSTYIKKLMTLFKSLENYGLIKALFFDDKVVSFTFKNTQVKSCLTSAGRLLELVVTVMALRAKDKNGEPVYNDVRTGVCIDWDTVAAPEYSADVANEIDVMIMKDLTPIFVSCKNGGFDANELYKLSVVAERFGGKYARKVLIASQSVDNTAQGRYLKLRADDMNIRIIDDFDRKSGKEIEHIFRNLWQST